MFFIERYIFRRIELEINARTNLFINKQIVLFSWLQPQHLDVQKMDLPLEMILQIPKTSIPMNKFTIFKQAIDHIVGKDTLKSVEDILPHVILLILNSKIMNIRVDLQIIEQFVFDIDLQPCGEKCIHLKQNVAGILDDGFEFDLYQGTGFYKVLLESSVQFIRELGFDKLNIEEKEFNENLEVHVKLLDQVVNESGKKGVLMHITESYKYFKGFFRR